MVLNVTEAVQNGVPEFTFGLERTLYCTCCGLLCIAPKWVTVDLALLPGQMVLGARNVCANMPSTGVYFSAKCDLVVWNCFINGGPKQIAPDTFQAAFTFKVTWMAASKGK